MRDFPVDDTNESFELEIDLRECSNGTLLVSIGYMTALFEAATVGRLGHDLAASLETVADRSDETARALSMLRDTDPDPSSCSEIGPRVEAPCIASG